LSSTISVCLRLICVYSCFFVNFYCANLWRNKKSKKIISVFISDIDWELHCIGSEMLDFSSICSNILKNVQLL
jgi:hypothetical protein